MQFQTVVSVQLYIEGPTRSLILLKMTEHPNWKALATVDFQWKCFVKGNSETNSRISCEDNKTYTRSPTSKSALTGQEAKEMYEDVVNLKCSQNHHYQQLVNLWESTKSTKSVSYRPNTSRCEQGLSFGASKDLESHCLSDQVCSNIKEISLSDKPIGLNLNLLNHHGTCSRCKTSTEREPKIHTDCHADRDLCQERTPCAYKLTSSDTFSNVKTVCTVPSTSLSKCIPNFTVLNSVMKEVQRNNVELVQKHIESGMDINAVDGFGWTMLMVAVCADAVDVVQLLLAAGADVNIKDKSGYNCYSLAKHHKKTHILKVLDNFKHTQKKSKANRRVRKPKLSEIASTDWEDFYCSTCNRSFNETTREKHPSSTVHLFNSRPQSLGTIYGIPESNVGYQILLKRGWDKESGLGPCGTGQKFPCKTVLKRDRKGLGVEQPKPRVTHFEPREEAAIKRVPTHRSKAFNKKVLAKKINQEKLKERKLRNELS